MPEYPYRMQLAEDRDQPGYVARSAIVTFYAASDTSGSAALALTDLSGATLANPVTTTADGFVPAFRAPVHEVMWRGDGAAGFMTSYEGLLLEARAAQSAAEESARYVRAIVASGGTGGTGSGTGPGIVPDPANDGMFITTPNSSIIEDPSNPGIYIIGA